MTKERHTALLIGLTSLTLFIVVVTLLGHDRSNAPCVSLGNVVSLAGDCRTVVIKKPAFILKEFD